MNVLEVMAKAEQEAWARLALAEPDEINRLREEWRQRVELLMAETEAREELLTEMRRAKGIK